MYRVSSDSADFDGQKRDGIFRKIEEQFVNVITDATYSKNPSQNEPKLLIIFYDYEPMNDALPEVHKPFLTVEVPKSFPYESNKWSLGIIIAITPTKHP